MEIDSELTGKSAKNTQRWWKLTATIVKYYMYQARIQRGAHAHPFLPQIL